MNAGAYIPPGKPPAEWNQFWYWCECGMWSDWDIRKPSRCPQEGTTTGRHAIRTGISAKEYWAKHGDH